MSLDGAACDDGAPTRTAAAAAAAKTNVILPAIGTTIYVRSRE
jgi:hypothetical protein